MSLFFLSSSSSALTERAVVSSENEFNQNIIVLVSKNTFSEKNSSSVKKVSRKQRISMCEDKLASTLFRVGFRGESHRQAWAIAMRESQGKKKAISHTNDYGIFQFNKATWGKQDWWSDERLLKRVYNAKIAYKLSRGGKTWYPWGLSGSGKVRARAYRNIGWSKSQVRSHIKKPYKKFYKKYMDLPEECRAKKTF